MRRQMKEECMRAWDYLQKTSGLLLNANIIKKANKTMMEVEKGVLVREYKKSPVFLRYRWMTSYIIIPIPMTLQLIPF